MRALNKACDPPPRARARTVELTGASVCVYRFCGRALQCRRRTLAAALVAVFGCVWHVCAERALRLDIDGTVSLVHVESLTEAGPVLRDIRGRLETDDARQIVALLFADPQSTSDPTHGLGTKLRESDEHNLRALKRQADSIFRGVLVTTDGMRLPGGLALINDNDTTEESSEPNEPDQYDPPGSADSTLENEIVWAHPRFGMVRIPIERIASITLDARAAPMQDAVPLQDQIELANGDRLEGFVIAAGELFAIETRGTMIEVPASRVDAVRFANPREERRGVRIQLDDGTIVAPAALIATAPSEGATSSDVLLRIVDETEATYPLSAVMSITYASGSIVPLAQLDRSGVTTRLSSPPHPDDAALLAPVPLGLASVRLAGPGSAGFELPRGARRLVGTLTMPIEAEPWGACEVVIEADGVELFSAELRSGTAPVALNLELPNGAASLRVRLGEGEFGPVQDIIELRRAAVLIER